MQGGVRRQRALAIRKGFLEERKEFCSQVLALGGSQSQKQFLGRKPHVQRGSCRGRSGESGACWMYQTCSLYSRKHRVQKAGRWQGNLRPGSGISSLDLGKGDREKIVLASCDKTDMGVTMSSRWTRRTKDSV